MGIALKKLYNNKELKQLVNQNKFFFLIQSKSVDIGYINTLKKKLLDSNLFLINIQNKSILNFWDENEYKNFAKEMKLSSTDLKGLLNNFISNQTYLIYGSDLLSLSKLDQQFFINNDIDPIALIVNNRLINLKKYFTNIQNKRLQNAPLYFLSIITMILIKPIILINFKIKTK